MREEFSVVKSGEFDLRPCTPADLCKMYGVTRKTILRWLKPFAKEIGQRYGHFYNIAQVEKIVKILGVPGRMLEDED